MPNSNVCRNLLSAEQLDQLLRGVSLTPGRGYAVRVHRAAEQPERYPVALRNVGALAGEFGWLRRLWNLVW